MASISFSIYPFDKVALEHLVKQKLSEKMMLYLADTTCSVVNCDISKTLPALENFINRLVTSVDNQTLIFMSTLVFLNRFKSAVSPEIRDGRISARRLFLGALILSEKYLNDNSLKNKYWAKRTIMEFETHNFGLTLTEVNKIEKHLLFFLRYDLRITEDDLYRELRVFLKPLCIKFAMEFTHNMRHWEEENRIKRQKEQPHKREARFYQCTPSGDCVLSTPPLF